MATTETEKQATNENEARESGTQEQQAEDSGAKKALKVGALAAAAGTAAFAASKAMSSRGQQGQSSEGSENGSGRGGRASMEQVVSAIGSARWDVLKDIIVPFAESGARAAGVYMGKDAPEFVSDTLVPKFIEGFNSAQEKRSE